MGAEGAAAAIPRLPRFKVFSDRLSRYVLLIPSGGIPRPTRSQLLFQCTMIFLLALGVRLLHWQDSHVWIVSGKASLAGVYERYHKEAERMLADRAVLFPRERPVDGDARMLVHPPGYAMIVAAVLAFSNDPYPALWFVQIVGDAVAAVLVFLIAAELVPLLTALIAGLLVAVSPHLAYYSLILSPDSLPVLPILVAVYLIVRATKRPRLLPFVLAGAMVGLSCWLRANALAFAPLLSALVLFLFWKGKRWRYALGLLSATIVLVSPITIRNLIVFHRFIPISIAAGLNLSEGIGNYNPDGSLGMPRSDREARSKDVEWSGRQDYAGSLWSPDGIERDRVRWNRGMEVIRARPVWFLGVMLRRAGFMLRYNDWRAHEFPFNTANVPIIAAERGFGHPIAPTDGQEPRFNGLPSVLAFNGAVIPQSVAVGDSDRPAVTVPPGDLLAQGMQLASGPGGQGSIALTNEGGAVKVVGDRSAFGDQFASAPIDVEKNSDYVLVLQARLVQGDMAVKVTDDDRRIALASLGLAVAHDEVNGPPDEGTGTLMRMEGTMAAIQLPFATGKRNRIRLVISNNSALPSTAEIGGAQLFKMGATLSTWTRYPRGVLRGIERNLFTTTHMLPLVIIGLVLLLFGGQVRIAALLLVLPFYYLSAQSVLSTEYRYILGIHYFLFILAALPIGFLVRSIWAGVLRTAARLRPNAGKQG